MHITPTLMLLSWVLHVHGDPSPISEQLESASDDFILASELSDDRNLALRGSHSDAMNDNSSSEPVILSDERSLGPLDVLIGGAKDLIAPIADTVGVKHTCTTDKEKAKFEAGGWKATYLPPLWDSKIAANAGAGLVIALAGTPATAAAFTAHVKEEFANEMRKNADGAREFMAEIGGEGKREFEKAIREFMNSGGRLKEIPLDTMNLKAAVIRVECKNCLAGKCMAAEGNQRIGLAYRKRKGPAKSKKPEPFTLH